MKKYLVSALVLLSINFTKIGGGTLPESYINKEILSTVISKPEHDKEMLNKVLNHFRVSIDTNKVFPKLIAVSDSLGIKPEWLLKAICRESRANPKAKNPYTNATGIIQWLPSTARDLGTTVDDIYNMSFEKQLDLVVKYFNRVNTLDKVNSYEDLYLSIFYPRAVGQPDNYIIGDVGSRVVKYNYPMSKNGKITVADFKRYAKVNI